MKLIILKYTCAPYGHSFDALSLSPYDYGQFLLRSAENTLRYMNSFDDATFDEISKYVEVALQTLGAVVPDQSDIMHATLSEVASDLDESGQPFLIGLKPSCPVCGSHDMATWEVVDFREPVDVDVPPLTHHQWNQLNAIEKYAAVFSYVQHHLKPASQPQNCESPRRSDR